jgi:CelD/BcsL family acetyltransferase involved in cellulose biosynthesis
LLPAINTKKTMTVQVVSGVALKETQRDRWRELQHANPALQSPYFCIEFTEAVAQARDDVEVAVIEKTGQPVAFFPYQRGPGSVALPVASFLSDYHGFICAPEFTCDPVAVVNACSLVAWDFDHLIVTQPFFAKHHRHVEPSPQMDLSRGYESYATDCRAGGSEQIKKCGNLMRRIAREIGPLRLVIHSTDLGHFAQVLAWKSQQYRNNNWNDIFTVAWIRDTVDRIYKTQTPAFAGMLSLLYAGDSLIAGHFGMRSASVWHYWFPTYDEKYAKYSPGLVLLLKMAEKANSLGVQAIDLGKGMHLYKQRLMNKSVLVAEGSVNRSSFVKMRRQIENLGRADVLGLARGLVLQTPLGDPARRMVKYLKRR